MTIKEKIREILAVYNDYTNNTEYSDMKITSFNYDDEDFDIYEEDVEKANEIIKDLERLKKQDEVLKIIKEWFIDRTMDYRNYDNTFFVDTFIRKEEPIFNIINDWVNGKI